MSSSISFSGLASGIDTESIVQALMDVERQPLERLQNRQTVNDERLNAYSSFNSLLEKLQSSVESLADESTIQSSTSSLSNEDTISIESSGETMEGSYNIVVEQLSQVQKNVSTGFDSKSDNILGTGNISFDILDDDGNVTDTYNIDVTSDNSNLKELAKSINDRSDETGITASIIDDGNDSGNYHLVFSGTDAGTKFNISSNLTGADFNDANTTQTQAAQQAIAYVDGIKIVSDNNTLEEAVPGVNITLDSVSSVANADATDPMQKYSATRLTVEPDQDAMGEKVNTFVEAYNNIMKYLNKGTEDSTSMNSYLSTDSTVKNLKSRMQGLLSETFAGNNSGAMSILSQAGIETQKDGTLEVDSTKLSDALKNHYTDFVNMFAGTSENSGIMDKFESLMDSATDSVTGLYATKKESHDSLDRSLDNRIAAMESRLAKREVAIYSQFSAMESLISSWNAQASFLTSSLSSLE